MKVLDPSIRMMVGDRDPFPRQPLFTRITKAEMMRIKILARGKDSTLKLTDKQATL